MYKFRDQIQWSTANWMEKKGWECFYKLHFATTAMQLISKHALIISRLIFTWHYMRKHCPFISLKLLSLTTSYISSIHNIEKKNVGINSVFHDTTLYVICFTLTLPCCEHLNKEGYHLLIHYVTCTSIIANIRGDQFCHSLQVPLLICNIWSGGHLAPSQTASTCENNQLNYFFNLFQDSRINSSKNKRIACHQQVHLRVECPWDTLYFYTKQMRLVVVLGLKYTDKKIVKNRRFIYVGGHHILKEITYNRLKAKVWSNERLQLAKEKT